MYWLIIPAVIIALILAMVIRTLCIGKKTTYLDFSDDQARIDEYSEKLSRMVQVETVSHRGQPEPEKFRAFHETMAELFPTVFEKMEKIDIDGNLLMKWKGKNPDLEPIILTSHQDVVPAEGTWKYPPFSGAIAEGKVWGRGAADIKGGVMCFYQACEELLREGYQPECDVYLGSSCTEEIGGDGAPKLCQWFKDQGIHLFLLSDEGGSLVQDPVPGVPGNFAAVGIFEKGYGDLRFYARGNGGHSSTPPKNTPIARLAKFVTRVESKSPFKAKFSPAVDSMFLSLAPYCTKFGLKLIMSNLWLLKPLVKNVIPAISTEAGAMLKTTCAFTMQKGSDGYNVIPQEAWVVANLRYIPHQSMDESNEIMRKLAAKYDLEMEVVNANPPSKELDLKGEAYALAKETISDIFPGVGIMPYVVTGGTDARFYGDVCDSAIRFSPINFGPEQMAGMHGLNENVEQATLPGGVDFYKALIKKMEKRK